MNLRLTVPNYIPETTPMNSPSLPGLSPLEKQQLRIQRLQEDILDIKYEIEKSQDLHEAKLKGFGDIVGYNILLESELDSISHSDKTLLQPRGSFSQELNEIDGKNKRLQMKLDKNVRIFEELQKFGIKTQNKKYPVVGIFYLKYFFMR